jgi:hypothetical protein
MNKSAKVVLDRVAQCHEGNGTRDQTLCPSLGLHCDRTQQLEKKEEDWPLGAPLVSQAGARPVSLPPAPDSGPLSVMAKM